MKTNLWPPADYQWFHIGQEVEFQDEGKGVIDQISDYSIHITSNFFTGWMKKVEYWQLLGDPYEIN